MENNITYETKMTICGNEDDTEFKDFMVGLLEPMKRFCESKAEFIEYSARINEDKNMVEFITKTQNENVSREIAAQLMVMGAVMVGVKAVGKIKSMTNEAKSTLKL